MFQLGFEGLNLCFGFLAETGLFLTLLLGFLTFAFSVLAEPSLFLALLLGFLLSLFCFLNPASVKVGR